MRLLRRAVQAFPTSSATDRRVASWAGPEVFWLIIADDGDAYKRKYQPSLGG
jgi:hypothetical protein